MKLNTLLLLPILLFASLTPTMAKEWALKLEEKSGEQKNQIRYGHAELDLSSEPPTLTLREQGQPEEVLQGMPVFAGYLFTKDIADIRAVLPKSGGMIAAIQSVSQIRQAETIAGGLRVRAEPNTSAAIVGNLKGGQVVEVLEEKDGWARIKFDFSKEGWSKIAGNSEYLRLRTVHKLTNVPGKRSVFLQRRGPGWQGQIKEGAAWNGDLVLRSDTHRAPTAKRVLAVGDLRHNGDGGAFKAYCNRIKTAYEAQGYQTVIADVDSWEDVIQELRAAAEAGAPYSRFVVISHGGWDGPVLHSHVGTRQISGKYNEDLWDVFVEAVKVGTTPNAKILNSSCHAAGTARSEDISYGSDYRWVHDLAHRTGRMVAGPAGKTSTEWTQRHMLAALEGQGTVVQEVHVARGDKLRILFPGQSLNSVQTQPLPPIMDLPEAEPAPGEVVTVEGAAPPSSAATAPGRPLELEGGLSHANRETVNRPVEAELRTDAEGRPLIDRPLGR